MEGKASQRYDAVSVGPLWGVANAAGFHQTEMHRDLPVGYPFGVCWIDGRQVAVFIEMAMPAEVRADLASRRPDWLAALVYARVISGSRADIAVIEADVWSPDGADLPMCAFATACVASDLGLFAVPPGSFRLRFEARACTVNVSLEFDADTDAGSWSGHAALDAGLTG